MADISVKPLGHQLAFTLIDQAPAVTHDQEAGEDQKITDDVDPVHHGRPAAEKSQPEVAVGVGERIERRVAVFKPGSQNENGQRKAIHLCEESDEESGYHLKVSPFDLLFRHQETGSEKQKNQDISYHHQPETVSVAAAFSVHFTSFLFRSQFSLHIVQDRKSTRLNSSH